MTEQQARERAERIASELSLLAERRCQRLISATEHTDEVRQIITRELLAAHRSGMEEAAIIAWNNEDDGSIAALIREAIADVR